MRRRSCGAPTSIEMQAAICAVGVDVQSDIFGSCVSARDIRHARAFNLCLMLSRYEVRGTVFMRKTGAQTPPCVKKNYQNPSCRELAACYGSLECFGTVHRIGAWFSKHTRNTLLFVCSGTIPARNRAASVPQHLSSTLPHELIDLPGDRFGVGGCRRPGLGYRASTSVVQDTSTSFLADKPNADAFLVSFVRQLCVIEDTL